MVGGREGAGGGGGGGRGFTWMNKGNLVLQNRLSFTMGKVEWAFSQGH